MSDKKATTEAEVEKTGLSRRGFLGATAVTGATLAAGAATMGTSAISRDAQAKTKQDPLSKAHVGPAELDEYYGVWSGGQSGEVRILGIPSMRELMRIPVFNKCSATGWGYTNESKEIFGETIKWNNGDTHHPQASKVDGSYDGKYAFIQDKANTRVARIRLDIMKTDKITFIPNVQAIHGMHVQRVPKTTRVFANGEFIVPFPNDGKLIDKVDEAEHFTMYSALDAETMEVVWQCIVDGNLDNTATDYTGKYAGATCYNSEMAHDLAGMMRNERDWVVVFNIPRIEQAVKEGKYITLPGSKVPVVDGRKKDGKNTPFTRYIPVPKNPHGIHASPDGKYWMANGKLSPTVSVIALDMLDDLFADKLSDERDVIVAEPELGLGPLHTTFDGRGNAYSSLFIDSQVAKWNIQDAIDHYNGKDVNYLRQKVDVHYQPGHLQATLGETRDADGKWLCVLSKFSKDRFLPVGPLRPENDQLFDISGEKMILVHDGPAFAEPHDVVMIRRDQILTQRTWSRQDPFFASAIERAKADGVDVEKDNTVIRDGNKVRVYMFSVAPSFGLSEFEVNEGDEVTVTVTNLDRIEDLSHGFCMVNHGVSMEISPQQTSSITFIADQPGVHHYYCTWFCHALHMEMAGRMKVRAKA